jgi:hypothetical protein
VRWQKFNQTILSDNEPNETSVPDNQDEEVAHSNSNYVYDVDSNVPDIEIINDLNEWYSSPFEEEQ